jgi:hypothetical protein
MRNVVVFVALCVAGCVVPVKETYYEAVDKPWSKGTYNGSLTNCPPRGYGVDSERSVDSGPGYTHIFVTAGYGHGTRGGQVGVDIWVAGNHQLKFPSWDLRLRSLADPQTEVAIPLSFKVDCTPPRGGSVTYCAIPAEPKILFGGGFGSTGHPRSNTFQAAVDVPPEFENGFFVVLPEMFDDGTSRIDSKPLRFELRRNVIWTGPMGC